VYQGITIPIPYINSGDQNRETVHKYPPEIVSFAAYVVIDMDMMDILRTYAERMCYPCNHAGDNGEGLLLLVDRMRACAGRLPTEAPGWQSLCKEYAACGVGKEDYA
jgi:hypothetical protein